tara:strand:- start:538 stop:1599 length:1062 start_codon:yes stop_codon:yes gene_type:complete
MADNKIINPRRPIPTSGYDRLKENLSSGFANEFPVQDFPSPDNRANINKGDITTRKDDNVGKVYIGLEDHDKAIAYYFKNIIKPHVLVNGNRTKVPVLYGSSERWNNVQKDGYYRDKEGKIQTPLIYFKRDGIEKRRDLGNKLDGNNPQLYYTFQEKYTKKNQYDNFSVLQNREPQKEFHRIVIPDFVKLTYTATIWCDFISQMNGLVESINYSSDSYWGDPERFKFNAQIDNYTNTTELNVGDNRIVKTDFTITLQGYLVPESINKLLSQKSQKSFSKSIFTVNNELSLVKLDGPSLGRNLSKRERKDIIEQNISQVPTDRSSVRDTSGGQRIQELVEGIGFMTIQDDFIIF